MSLYVDNTEKKMVIMEYRNSNKEVDDSDKQMIKKLYDSLYKISLEKKQYEELLIKASFLPDCGMWELFKPKIYECDKLANEIIENIRKSGIILREYKIL